VASDSVPVRQHIPCPKCGSSDAATEYSDGRIFCFSCRKTTRIDGRPMSAPAAPAKAGPIVVSGEYQDLPERGISEKTCRKFGYAVLKTKAGLLHLAPFRDDEGHRCPGDTPHVAA